MAGTRPAAEAEAHTVGTVPVNDPYNTIVLTSKYFNSHRNQKSVKVAPSLFSDSTISGSMISDSMN
jgi:hypothetical protein